MIKQCKKCGSKNLFLEPRMKGQDVMTADMVALKCKDCGAWLKWSPKDERKYYLSKQPKEEDIKWQKLKEILKRQIDIDSKEYLESGFPVFKNYVTVENFVLQKMQELEGEDVKD